MDAVTQVRSGLVVRRASVKLHLTTGDRNVTRTVHYARPTGHVAKDWGGTRHHQWTGWITYYGKEVQVWAYVSENGGTVPPYDWANDTY